MGGLESFDFAGYVLKYLSRWCYLVHAMGPVLLTIMFAQQIFIEVKEPRPVISLLDRLSRCMG